MTLRATHPTITPAGDLHYRGRVLKLRCHDCRDLPLGAVRQEKGREDHATITATAAAANVATPRSKRVRICLLSQLSLR